MGIRAQNIGATQEGERSDRASRTREPTRALPNKSVFPTVLSAGSMGTLSSRNSILVMPWSLRAGVQVRH